MAYEQSPRPVPKAHSMNMENREKLSLSGVEDVSGFDENLVGQCPLASFCHSPVKS